MPCEFFAFRLFRTLFCSSLLASPVKKIKLGKKGLIFKDTGITKNNVLILFIFPVIGIYWKANSKLNGFYLNLSTKVFLIASTNYFL